MPEALESDTVDGWLALDDADAAGAAYALVAFLARNLWGAKNRVPPANPHFSGTRAEF